MGFVITIGEAEPYVSLRERLARMSVREETSESVVDAPLDYKSTNKTMPSYSDWATSMKELGLRAMWYGDDCRGGDRGGFWTGPSGEEHDALLQQHPGCVEISADHLATIDEALARWDRGEVIPHRYKATEEWRVWKGGLIRWLHFWFHWAVENCEYPSVANR